MAAQTDFARTEITNLSQEHENVADTITREISRMHDEIEMLKASSSSRMTGALDSAYQQFRQEMEGKVLPELNQMAADMRSAVGVQEQTGEENAAQVQQAGSQLTGFLSGA